MYLHPSTARSASILTFFYKIDLEALFHTTHVQHINTSVHVDTEKHTSYGVFIFL